MDSDNDGVDVQRLIGAVAARHGILLKPDDAAFALVTINQLVLEEVMATVLEKVQAAVADFDEAAIRVQTRAGSLLASEVNAAAAAIRGGLENDIAAAGKQAQLHALELHRAHSRAAREQWLALGIVCALICFVCGMFVAKLLQ